MSSDRFDVLERFAPLFEAPERSFEAFLRRRDRKRRNQRISAGVVGIAVFVTTVWIATTGGPFDRTQLGTGPTVPPSPERVGVVGLPPEGATPSTPETGELVLSFSGRFTATGGSRTWVYADGRMIWHGEGNLPEGSNETTTGLLERRLSPEGVELLRSELLSTGLFGHDLSLVSERGLGWGTIEIHDGDRLVRVEYVGDYQIMQGPFQNEGTTIATAAQESALEQLDARLADPVSWLPASAWKDREIRAYVPSRYAVCYRGSQPPIERSRILSLLPQPAADLLRAKDTTRFEGRDPLSITYCSQVTTEEARALADILAEEVALRGPYALGYWVAAPGSRPGSGVHIGFEPTLPHGERICLECG
jgi:hypothetical protein